MPKENLYIIEHINSVFTYTHYIHENRYPMNYNEPTVPDYVREQKMLALYKIYAIGITLLLVQSVF